MTENNRSYRSLFWVGMSMRHSNPSAAIAVLEKARNLAKEADDLNTVLEYNHWILQTLIFKLRDIKKAYPLAVEMAVEARKEIYQHQREHICTYQDLILTYMGSDPLGHEQLIEEALDYMQGEIGNRKIQCRLCLQGLRCEFETERGDYDAARLAIDTQMAMAENDFSRDHHQAQAYTTQMTIAFRENDTAAMQEAAQLGLERTRGKEDLLADFCIGEMTLAYVYEKQGDTATSDIHYQRAASDAEGSSVLMPGDYYEIARGVHTLRGDHAAVVRLADNELAQTKGLGLAHRESKIHLARCTALKALGKLADADINAAQTAINALKAPDVARAQLRTLTDA